MSNVGLFAVGGVVTLLVAASMVLLIWGAVMDGRYNDERRAAEVDSPGTRHDETVHALDAA